MKVWSPLLDVFFSTKETSNGVDKDAVALICINSCGREEVVGHTPQNISKVVPLYLSLPHSYLEPEVTRKHVKSGGSYGLEIPSRSCFYGPEKFTQWLETRLTNIEEQSKESVNYYLK